MTDNLCSILWYEYNENGKTFSVYFCSDENDFESYFVVEEPMGE